MAALQPRLILHAELECSPSVEAYKRARNHGGSKLLGATWLGQRQGRKLCTSAQLERRGTAEAAAAISIGSGSGDNNGRGRGPFLAPYNRIAWGFGVKKDRSIFDFDI
jgi:hypothetical protein